MRRNNQGIFASALGTDVIGVLRKGQRARLKQDQQLVEWQASLG